MTSQPMSDESPQSTRREFNRRKFPGQLEIEWGSATLTATVRDIGPHGLFVELAPPLWVGARFHARLIVNPVLELDCTVRRVEPGGGIGISFEEPGETGKVQLSALLATLPQS